MKDSGGRAPSGYGDLHSHLVPGVDDGARSLEDSLEGLGRMVDAGIIRVVTTPHVSGSLTLRTAELRAWLAEVDEAWHRVSTAAAERFPELDFRQGHEVRLDVPDPDLSDERLRLGGTSFALVEWDAFRAPPRTEEVLTAMTEAGVRPILAHPERYAGMDASIERAGRWRDAGARLQVNAGSLVGRYGHGPRAAALALLERGWADYLSSDFHGRPEYELHVTAARERLEEAGAGEQFRLLAGENPARLFRDEEPLPVPPMRLEEGIWSRLRSLLS